MLTMNNALETLRKLNPSLVATPLTFKVESGKFAKATADVPRETKQRQEYTPDELKALQKAERENRAARLAELYDGSEDVDNLVANLLPPAIHAPVTPAIISLLTE